MAVAGIADERSVFHHYRRLIELRHTVPRPDLDVTEWADAEVLLDNLEPDGAAFTGRLEPWQALVLRRTTRR